MRARLSPVMRRVLLGEAYTYPGADGSVALNDVRYAATMRALLKRGLIEEHPARPGYYVANAAGRQLVGLERLPTGVLVDPWLDPSAPPMPAPW